MTDETPNPQVPPDSGRAGPQEGRRRFERVFEVSIDGAVPPALLAKLGDVEVSSQEMRTVLTGHFQDQSEVYGFLERLRAYALEVVEVRRIGSARDSVLPDEEVGGR
jgi:hypothetical protein